MAKKYSTEATAGVLIWILTFLVGFGIGTSFGILTTVWLLIQIFLR